MSDLIFLGEKVAAEPAQSAMTDRWDAEVDAFIRRFAERAWRWAEWPGDLEESAIEPWDHPDQPDPVLDAAYRSGIVPPDQRRPGVGESITVLRARGGRRLAKVIGRDGSIASYDSAKTFDMVEIPVDGLDQVEEDLRRLLHQPDRCIVRGGIADLGRCRKVRRLLHPEGDDPASLVEVPRRWLALDIDDLPRPGNVAAEDVAACAEIAVAALPTEFRAARCIAQATAGHGFKPGIRMRAWFWLNRPVGGAELKRWLPPALVDHALFGAAQIIYTAAPIFDGSSDPLLNRMIRLSGAGQVNVPDLPEPKPRPAPAPVKPAAGLNRYGEAALDSACQRIISAPKNSQETTINREVFAIGTLAAAGALPPGFARAALLHASSKITDYDTSRRWRAGEIESKVNHAFDAGMRRPRAQQ